MADLLLLTPTAGGSAQVLPALGLLSHRIRVLPAEPSALVNAAECDLVLLDARRDLAAARTTCRLLRATGLDVPLILILTEGGLTVVKADWGADDLLLETASPAEVEARFRLAIERSAASDLECEPQEFSAGELTIDAGGYSARVHGRPLDLTYKEFELIKYLVQHPGRVFTRAQLLQEVWGTTTTAARAPWTCMCGGCGPSSARRTSSSSARSATWATASTHRRTGAIPPSSRHTATPPPTLAPTRETPEAHRTDPTR